MFCVIYHQRVFVQHCWMDKFRFLPEQLFTFNILYYTISPIYVGFINISRKMPLFTKFVEPGRLCLITYGPDAGKVGVLILFYNLMFYSCASSSTL